MTSHAYGGKGPFLIALNYSLFVIGTILVFLRTFHRIGKDNPGALWAYVWSQIAWICATVALVFLTLSVSHGMGMHADQLQPPQISQAIKWVWVMQSAQVVSYGFSKAAVVAFLLELQGPTYSRMRWFLIFLATMMMLLDVILPFLIMFQCTPPDKLWDPTVQGTCNSKPGVALGYLQGTWSAFMDFFLSVYPSVIVWRLQMAIKLKIGVASLMALGVLMGVCAIGKTVEISVIDKTNDPTYDLFRLVSWSTTEMWVTIIIPCIPPLWPLFRQTFNVFSNKIPSRRKGTAQSSNNHIANSYLRPSDRHVAGTSAHARDFRRLGSQDNSEDDFMPPDDGILMTRNISINQKPTPTISSSASQT